MIPCRISSTPDWNDYRPTLVEGEEAERIKGKAKGLLQEQQSLFHAPNIPPTTIPR